MILTAKQIPHWKLTAHFNRHNQVIFLQFKKSRILNTEVMVRVLKQQPEMIGNNIQGNLATTHRPPDKGHDDIVGIIEEKLIA